MEPECYTRRLVPNALIQHAVGIAFTAHSKGSTCTYLMQRGPGLWPITGLGTAVNEMPGFLCLTLPKDYRSVFMSPSWNIERAIPHGFSCVSSDERPVF